MDRSIQEVRWITYPHTGEQGWATVDADNEKSFIFYGADALSQAVYQARITNRRYGYYEPVTVRGPQPRHCNIYQWMS